MKEIYNEIFGGAGIVTRHENEALWAEFGMAIYEKYLQKEHLLQQENNQLKDDLKRIGLFIPASKKKTLSKRLRDNI